MQSVTNFIINTSKCVYESPTLITAAILSGLAITIFLNPIGMPLIAFGASGLTARFSFQVIEPFSPKIPVKTKEFIHSLEKKLPKIKWVVFIIALITAPFFPIVSSILVVPLALDYLIISEKKSSEKAFKPKEPLAKV